MFGFGKKSQAVTVDLHAPFEGEVVPVDQVPDPVFAGKMVGDGFAVNPTATEGIVEVCSPVAGRLATLMKSLHAFAVVTDEGLEVLVHVGIDTVELKGEGFEALAAKGDTVSAGQPIVRVDIAAVEAAGRLLVTPVVMSNKKQVADISLTPGPASSGATVCTVTMASE